MHTAFNNTRPTSIDDLCRDINDKKVLLPEFQRDFIWTIEQTVDLFDSLARGIFIGAFIFAKPKFSLSCRELDARPRKGKGQFSQRRGMGGTCAGDRNHGGVEYACPGADV